MDRLQDRISNEMGRIKEMFHVEYSNPSFLPINLTGGIGDSILALHTIKRLEEMGYELAVYTQHYDALRYFNKTSNILNGHMPYFTWHMELDSISRFVLSNIFDGFLNERLDYLYQNQINTFKSTPSLRYLIKDHPKYKYLLTRTINLNVKHAPLYCLGIEPDEITQPDRINTPDKQITIHDGYDINSLSQVTDRSTKQWPIRYWNELVLGLKKSYPDHKIIQLGSKTGKSIYGTDECLLNKTTITEAFDIISRSSLHIDTDSGLVHAATEMGVPCVVMFGPTPKDFYGHKQNINLSSDACSGGCFFLSSSWMDKCPIFYERPECMYGIQPEVVLSAVSSILK